MKDHAATPTSIERDLAETRARLGYHLDELTRRLSPGQLVDEGLAYLRDGQGAAFARNLGSQVRDNPLPVALTGIGLAWLALASGMTSNNGSSRRDVVPYDPEYARNSIVDDMAAQVRRAGEAVIRTAEETEDAFKARVAEARARVLGLRQEVAETVSDFAERVQQAFDAAQQKAREAIDRIAEHGQGAGEAVGHAAQRGREFAARAGNGIAETVGENPLLLGALGLTAGVLLGALLPRTAQEDALIGPVMNLAADTAREVAGKAMDRGAKAAEAAASAAWETVKQS